jgi:hypothetical protein
MPATVRDRGRVAADMSRVTMMRVAMMRMTVARVAMMRVMAAMCVMVSQVMPGVP